MVVRNAQGWAVTLVWKETVTRLEVYLFMLIIMVCSLFAWMNLYISLNKFKKGV